MPLNDKDIKEFENIQKLEQQRDEVYRKIYHDNTLNSHLDLDEANNVYNFKMNQLKTTGTTAIYDAAYQGAKGIYGDKLDLKNKQHNTCLSDWLSFLKTNNFENVENPDNAIFIIKTKVDEKNARQSQFNVLDKFIEVGIGSIPLPGGKILVSGLRQGGKFVWKILKEKSAEKSYVPDTLDYYKKFIEKWGKSDDVLIKFLNDPEIIMNNDVNKLFWKVSLEKKGHKPEDAERISNKINDTKRKETKKRVNKKLNSSKENIIDTQDYVQNLQKEEPIMGRSITDVVVSQIDRIESEANKSLEQANDFMDRDKQIAKIEKFDYEINEIEGVQKSFHFLGQLGRLIDSPELIKVSLIGQGCANLLNSIAQLQKVNASYNLAQVGGLALVGGYFGVGLAVLGLVSTFMDQGPSADEIIIDYLKKLGEYIDKQFNEVHKQFNQVHQELQIIHKDMIASFKHLEQLCRANLEVVQRLEKSLEDFKKPTQIQLDRIDIKLDEIHEIIDHGHREIQFSEFYSTLRQLNGLLKNNGYVKDLQNLMNKLVGDYITTMSTSKFHTGELLFNSSEYITLTPHAQDLAFTSYTSLDKQFVTDSERYEQSIRIDKVLKRGKLDYGFLIGFLASYANDILADEYMSVSEVDASLNYLNTNHNSTQVKISALESEINMPRSLPVSPAQQKALNGKNAELIKNKKILNRYEVRMSELKNVRRASEEAQNDNDCKYKIISEKLRDLISKRKGLNDTLDTEINDLKNVERDISILLTTCQFVDKLNNNLNLDLDSINTFNRLYSNYIKNYDKKLTNKEINSDSIQFIKEKLAFKENDIYIDVESINKFKEDIIQRNTGINVLVIGNDSIQKSNIINNITINARHNNKYQETIYDYINEVNFIDVFNMSITSSQTDNVIGSIVTREMLKQAGHFHAILIAFDPQDLVIRATSLEYLLDSCLMAFQIQYLDQILPSIVWVLSDKSENINKQQIQVQIDQICKNIASRYEKEKNYNDLKKLHLLDTMKSQNIYFVTNRDGSINNLLNHLNTKIVTPISHKALGLWGDIDSIKSLYNIINIINNNANGILLNILKKQQKIADLQRRIALVDQDIFEVDLSKQLINGYKRISPKTVIFNNYIWRMGITAYLAILENKTLSPYYKDSDYKHIMSMIIMGENLITTTNMLANNSELFKSLWRSYANVLLVIDSFYQEKYDEYLSQLSVENKDNLVSETIADPKLIRVNEDLFAKQLLDINSSLGAEFNKYLFILDVQKRLFLIFCEILRTSDANVIDTIKSLPDKNIIQESVTDIINYKKPGLFSNNAVFSSINQAYYVFSMKLFQSYLGPSNLSNVINTTISPKLQRLYKCLNEKKFQLYSNISNNNMLQVINENSPQLSDQPKENFMNGKKKTFAQLIILALKKAYMNYTQNGVLVLGITGSGKSTLINYLLGCIMKYARIPEQLSEVLLVDNCFDKINLPEIGFDVSSKTLFPAGYLLNQKERNVHRNMFLIDYPGFEGNREKDITLLETIATQVAIKTTKFIKGIIVVVSYLDLVQNKMTGFKIVIETISTLFKNPNDHANSIRLVISHLPRNEKITKNVIVERLRQLHKFISNKLRNEDTIENRSIQYFIGLFLKNMNNVFLFDPLTDHTRIDLLNNIDASLPFSSSEMNLVGGQAINNEFVARIDEIINNGNRVFRNLLTLPSEIKNLEDKKIELEKIITAINKDIENLRKSNTDKKEFDDQLNGIKTLIDQKTSEIQELSQAITTNDNKINTLQKRITALNNRTELVDYQTIGWDEHQVFGIIKQGIVHNKLMQYSGTPFTQTRQHDVVSSCNIGGSSGKFDSASEKSDPVAGKYEINYIGPEKCYGSAKISIQMEYRNQPNIKADIKLLSDQLLELNKSKTQLEAELELLKAAKADLETQYAKAFSALLLSDAEKTKLLIEAKLRTLDIYQKELTETSNKLGKCRIMCDESLEEFHSNKALYQILIKLNDLLELNSLAYTQFQKDYKESLVKFNEVELNWNDIANAEDKTDTADDTKTIAQFHRACTEGDIAIITQLIQDNSNIIYENNKEGLTPLDLILASQNTKNKNEIIRLLLLNGATDASKASAKALIDTFANSLYQQYPTDADALKNALDNIAILSNIHFTNDANQITETDCNDYEQTLQCQTYTEPEVEKENPLFKIARECDCEKLIKLFESEPKLDSKNHKDETVLDVALQHRSEKECVKFILTMVNAGARACKKQNASNIVMILHNNMNEQVCSQNKAHEFCKAHGLETLYFSEKNVHTAPAIAVDAAITIIYPVVDMYPSLHQLMPSALCNNQIQQDNLYNESDVASSEIIIATKQRQHQSANNIPFSAGAWDPTVERHPTTGEYIFTYRVYQDGKAAGSAKFYKYPMLCRSAEGDRHNIIEMSGVLSQVKITNKALSEIDNICESLPPTLYERLMDSAYQGAKSGAVKGLAGVVGHALRNHNVSAETAKYTEEAIYYGAYFAMRFFEYTSREKMNEVEEIFAALIKAAFDTLSMYLLSKVIELLSEATNLMREKANQNGWTKTGKMFKFFSAATPYTMHAYNTYRHGIAEAVTSIAAGTAAQIAIKQIGEKTVNYVKRKTVQRSVSYLIPGLIYQKVPGDSHCLFHAVGLHVNQDQAYLRRIVADHLERNKNHFRSFIQLPEGQTVENYIQAIREGKEWADHIEIEVLMRVLDRPIIVIGPDNKIRNRDVLERKLKGEPIFVMFNGHNHYDAFLRTEGTSTREIINFLTQSNERSLRR